MRAPEAVVFDLGKVLVDFDFTRAARALARASGLPVEPVRALIQESPTLTAFECGRLTARQFFEEVQRQTGFPGSFEEFARLFTGIFWAIAPMVALHGRLRAARVPCFVLSNTNELAVAQLRRQFPFFADFDGYVLSYEHGCMKPDPRLYEVVERLAGRTGPRLLYLDDRLENVQAGAARGWQAIHHQAAEATIPMCRRLGLPV